jgi:Zn-dependent protease with chaperone function
VFISKIFPKTLDDNHRIYSPFVPHSLPAAGEFKLCAAASAEAYRKQSTPVADTQSRLQFALFRKTYYANEKEFTWKRKIMSDISAQFQQCVSDEEKRGRASVTVVNVLVWLILLGFVIASMGAALLFILPGMLINYLMAEYNVRKLEAIGATVTPQQFATVHAAASAVCRRFNVAEMPRIVVINSGESNAMALKFARKRVVLILSELLDGIIENPEQLRFLIAHEMCHGALDHGARGVFEIYKPARYRQARELTCDNAGLIAAGDLAQSKTMLMKLCAGRRLFPALSESVLIAESQRIYSGFVGWLLRQYLTHPPVGARLQNLASFASTRGAALLPSQATPAMPPSMNPPLPPSF